MRSIICRICVIGEHVEKKAMPTITASIDGSAVKAQSRAGIAATDIQSEAARPIIAAES
jgi:hypothetical protein